MNERTIKVVVMAIGGVIGGLTGLIIAQHKTIKEMEVVNKCNRLFIRIQKNNADTLTDIIDDLQGEIKELKSKKEVKA